MDIIKMDDNGRVTIDGKLYHNYLLSINVWEIQNLIDNGKKQEAYDYIVKHISDYFKERIVG